MEWRETLTSASEVGGYLNAVPILRKRQFSTLKSLARLALERREDVLITDLLHRSIGPKALREADGKESERLSADPGSQAQRWGFGAQSAQRPIRSRQSSALDQQRPLHHRA